MSLRTIMIFPEFRNMNVIDSIRIKYDPLAKLVRPHITLVFPFDSDMSNDELSGVLDERLKDIPQFNLILQGFSKQSGPDGNWLCLDVIAGTEKLRTIHDVLYANEFKPFYHGFVYVPHMTVGRFDTEEELDKAFEIVKKKTDSFACKVNMISAEMIGEHEESIIILEKRLRIPKPAGGSDFPRSSFGAKKSNDKYLPPASLSDVRTYFRDERYSEARVLLTRIGNDEFGPEADLIDVLCCYQVRDTEALLNKVSSGARAVKMLFSRREMKKLATDLDSIDNDLVAHMVEYCFLNLMIHGLSMRDLRILFLNTSRSPAKRPSAFSQMDKEDMENFRREKAMEEARNPYEFDVFEEMDDIRVKFKSAVTNPDRDFSSVASANANLIADIFTLASRADRYYNPYENRGGISVKREEVREYDYGVNKPPKSKKNPPDNIEIRSGAGISDGDGSSFIYALITKLDNSFPTAEEKIKRRDALMEQIKYEEAQILS